jgi:hypothetical protein
LALTALSKKIDFTDLFGDITEAQHLASQFKKARNAKLEIELINSISFWTWIKELAPIKTKPEITLKGPAYRLTYGWSPLSILGSISDGGRFNVGGAQLCPELPDVKKIGALYMASTLACCYREIAANPAGKADEYELTPTRTYHLWDLSKVIIELNRPGLEDLVKTVPFEAIWGYQKVPMIPQLLAQYLHRLGGDGIAFTSTKDPAALNYCFFFKNEDEASAGFRTRRLN